MDRNKSSSPLAMEQALRLFNLTLPFSHEDLIHRYEEARRIWHPGRYAGLTNNPAKYMAMYKKGELQTKKIHEAYRYLLSYLKTNHGDSQCSPSRPTLTDRMDS